MQAHACGGRCMATNAIMVVMNNGGCLAERRLGSSMHACGRDQGGGCPADLASLCQTQSNIGQRCCLGQGTCSQLACESRSCLWQMLLRSYINRFQWQRALSCTKEDCYVVACRAWYACLAGAWWWRDMWEFWVDNGAGGAAATPKARLCCWGGGRT